MALFPMTQFDFPNVSNYDSDLREIIAMCKTLVSDYNTLVDGLNDLHDDFNEVVREFDKVKADFASLVTLVNDFENQIDAKVAEAMSVWSTSFIERIEALTEYIHETDEEFRRLANEMLANFTTLVDAAKDYADLKDAELFAHFTSEINDINQRIDDLVFELPNVYNITKGYETDLITCLYDIYDATRDHAYTARQFDTAGKTATELDALEITAFVWDTNGYDLLYPVGLVRNPYTGLYEDINDVLEQIAQAAAGLTSINATEYDALELTATEFEAYNMTAYMYDMYAKQILSA